MGDVHARADYMLEGSTGLGESLADELKDRAGLLVGWKILCADWSGPRDMNDVADAYGAGEANDGFVGRCAWNVGAGACVDGR
jgi:hypothetical protein